MPVIVIDGSRHHQQERYIMLVAPALSGVLSALPVCHATTLVFCRSLPPSSFYGAFFDGRGLPLMLKLRDSRYLLRSTTAHHVCMCVSVCALYYLQRLKAFNVLAALATRG